VHCRRIGPQHIDLTMLAASPQVMPDATGPDSFAILIGNSTVMHSDNLKMYNSYTDFEAALTTDLNGTTRVLFVEAVGHYDQASNTFTARHIGVMLSN